MKTRKATRKDVAAAAGVSVTTVTHALSETPGSWVKSSTRKHVQDVAMKLGYMPSFVGKSLATGRNYLVGLLHPRREFLSFQFYQDIMIGMTNAMEEDDYNLVMLFVSPERRYLKPIRQNRLDGVIILQSDIGDEHICEVANTGMPLVVVNKDIQNVSSNVGCVRSDHYKMMNMVIDDLIEKNCHSLLAIHDIRSCDANVLMHEAYSQILAEKALNHKIFGTTMIPDLARLDTLAVQLRNSFASGQKWEGIFVDGPHIADVFIKTAAEFDLKPGRDYYLVTSNIEPGVFTESKSELKCYAQNPREMGACAWRQLKEIIEGRFNGHKELIPYQPLNPVES